MNIVELNLYGDPREDLIVSSSNGRLNMYQIIIVDEGLPDQNPFPASHQVKGIRNHLLDISIFKSNQVPKRGKFHGCLLFFDPSDPRPYCPLNRLKDRVIQIRASFGPIPILLCGFPPDPRNRQNTNPWVTEDQALGFVCQHDLHGYHPFASYNKDEILTVLEWLLVEIILKWEVPRKIPTSVPLPAYSQVKVGIETE